MNKKYRTFFGLKKEPFAADLAPKEILQTEALKGVKDRFDYVANLGGVGLVTGEIGSGKTTALRYAADKLHPSEYQTFYVTATTGSILDLYRQIAAELGMYQSSNSKAVMTRLIRKAVMDLVEDRKIKAMLIIDEASLFRLEVFAELHTIIQFHQDTRGLLPVILAGQSSLVDKLSYHTSAPLASRIITRSHLEGLSPDVMKRYLEHHLKICGIKKNLFEEAAVTAVHQGSGGLLRKANHLARGGLIAAAGDKSKLVTAEHVRLASSEIF